MEDFDLNLFAQAKALPRLGRSIWHSGPLDSRHQGLVGCARVGHSLIYIEAGGERLEDHVHPTDMIGVPMGGDDQVEMVHAVRQQLVYDLCTGWAGIDQRGLPLG